MEGSREALVTGTGKTPDAAQQDAANKATPGKYSVSITGTVEKSTGPAPTPIGDYKAELTSAR